MAKKLNPKIVSELAKYTGLEESTCRKKIFKNKSNNPFLTSNASAHVIAKTYKKSLLRMLDDEDRASLRGLSKPLIASPNIENKTPKLKSRKKTIKKKPKILYQSDDYFINAHIEETTKAYYAKCYTSFFILTRKVIENLLIGILRKKFPSEPDLVLNTSSTRYHDFSVILKNLFDKRATFSHEGMKAIERINQLVIPFKKDANNKAHSWFHIVTSANEINKWQLDVIIELIKIVEKEVGLR